mgnify:CR=1 FL=1
MPADALLFLRRASSARFEILPGTGRDTFITRRGYGNDTIADYSVASAGVFYADKIDLSDFGFASFHDLVLSDIDGDAYIDLGSGDSITLEGVNSGNLSADDFSF